MKVKEMGKPKNRRPDERLIGTDIPEPIVLKPRRYTPPPCSCCTALRPAGKDFTEVYRTTREAGYVFRYCKCGFCGNTFKDSERV